MRTRSVYVGKIIQTNTSCLFYGKVDLIELISLILGIFTATVAGVYTVTLHVFSPGNHGNAKVQVEVDRADGSGTTIICRAAVASKTYGAATCGLLVELEVGDRMSCVGLAGEIHVSGARQASFYAYLLYKADVVA